MTETKVMLKRNSKVAGKSVAFGISQAQKLIDRKSWVLDDEKFKLEQGQIVKNAKKSRGNKEVSKEQEPEGK